jgi:DNA-directed RNA polymerase specialized sigma24 family protein
MLLMGVTFESFVRVDGKRLTAGLVAAYGLEVGHDAASDALAYGWEHWERLSAMENPVGYLYRVGQTAARRSRRRHGYLPMPDSTAIPDFEPGLLPALQALSEPQRVCIVMVHGYGWTPSEAAELLGIDRSTARTHIARAVARLQQTLEVTPHAN